METLLNDKNVKSYLLLHSANIVTCNEFKLETKATLSYYRWLVCSQGADGKIIDIGSELNNDDKTRLNQWKQKVHPRQIISGKAI